MSQLLVLDSGIGGLSILGPIRRQLPEVAAVYLADNARFPYGNLDDGRLIAGLETLIGRLLPVVRPDAVVVACNTASTIALEALRQCFALPFIGVVPAIKPAAALSRTRQIGLLATPATVERRYIQDLIRRFAADCTVIRQGSRRLAALAEEKLRGRAPDLQTVWEEIAPLFRQGAIDVVVLGCTHYWFLLEELQAASPWPVQWLDSGEAVARRTAEVLRQRPAPEREPLNEAAFTAPLQDCKELERFLSGLGITRITLLSEAELSSAFPSFLKKRG